MAHNPDLRFASSTEMRIALEGVLAGKRPPTVPIPQVVRAPEAHLTTGTVLGAPAEAALKPTPTPANPLGSTVRAAPARFEPLNGAAPRTGHIEEEAERPRRRFPTWLVVLPLLLGAGGVAAYVVVLQQGGGGGTSTATSTATTTTPIATTAVTTAAPTAPGKLSPLTPATVTTPTATGPRPGPSTPATASASSGGSATTDPTAPPTIGPIVIPGFTNDAGLLTVPTGLPSGFQLPFPPPAPAPTTSP